MIYTLTLNPAIDKILYIDKFERNVTTRIQNVVDTIGGKGTHVSVNLQIMGEDNCSIIATHGETGKKVEEMMKSYGVRVKPIFKNTSNTRTNYLLAEQSGDTTLITEKGAILEDKDIEDIITIVNDVICDGDYLVLSGDASNYPDVNVYARIMERMEKSNVRFIIDASGKYLVHSLSKRPFMIKPNINELAMICGKPIAIEEDSIIEAIDSLDKYGIEIIAVSLGKHGSLTKYNGSYYRAKAPKVNPVNTAGCGDCFVAGLIHCMVKGMEITGALTYATAVSAAKAECSLSVGFDKVRAKQLEEQVEVKMIDRNSYFANL